MSSRADSIIKRSVASTRVMAPPAASDKAGFVSEFSSGVSDVMQGRVTLLMLNTVVLGLVAFYIWTHDVQGGG